MDEKQGNGAVTRTVESIHIGRRHRNDLGDIAALAQSIDRDGLLQPITVTPDGVLVCGARRLAAIKQLGWTEVRVWVRSGISTSLGYMLAEQDDNVLHKPLTQLEAAALYREMKALLAEDAAQRKAATQLSTEHQPRWNGHAESAGPLETPLGSARRQAAEMITGTSSYTRLEEINLIQRTAEDSVQSEDLRQVAQEFLDEIRDGAPVHPRWVRTRELVAAATADRDVLLHRLAEEKLAEIKAGKKPKRRTPGADAPAAIEPMTVRAFVITWTELGGLCASTDPIAIAAKLTEAEADMFFAAIERWSQFADHLREALDQLHAENEAPPRLRAI
ncbi:Chromosome (plasmid) partitioning protein ParB [Microbacterium esteraromaticum]|uniref:Chromosome (Plasmid) partitioning protein ParB n=1 Tax=Microbacterium esteraromaticum TaxID=57043 RepID=A0A1R4KKN6_9MICO|nr:ParB N-terminal domain-containing protein [Microbacterium esteraromaticum]SJN44737.1 Chromosome (plasmid) partitioning protein ParB [Microbacterium esteraromaticum]